MKLDNAVMLMAGVMVLVFTLLSMYVNGAFMYVLLVIGVMMLQSAFTSFCPSRIILKSLGFKE
jgi:hypothetical protein